MAEAGREGFVRTGMDYGYMMSMEGIYRRRSLDLGLGVLQLYCTYIESMSGAGVGQGRDGRGLPACLCKLYLKGRRRAGDRVLYLYIWFTL